MTTETTDTEAARRLTAGYQAIRAELNKQIIGMDRVIEELMICIFSRGHCLLVGVPGLAKTLLVSSLAKTLSLSFARIQFTPDLMPADITGTEVIQEDKGTGDRSFKFLRGPIFANVILADEINRTPPKTQAALLEAMQEHQVTAGGQKYALDEPFFVLATENPIEQEGTYPLPEAQLDRFMFNVRVEYPSRDEELDIMRLTTSTAQPQLGHVLDKEEILRLQDTVRRVPVAEPVLSYAVRLVRATRIDSADAPPFVKECLAWGAGPRATQNLILGGKARALLKGRFYVATEDIRAVAHPVLRHRLITNYSAEAEGITSDKLIDQLLETVRPEGGDGGELPEVLGS
jgi:MoxR-like ATPase